MLSDPQFAYLSLLASRSRLQHRALSGESWVSGAELAVKAPLCHPGLGKDEVPGVAGERVACLYGGTDICLPRAQSPSCSTVSKDAHLCWEALHNLGS